MGKAMVILDRIAIRFEGPFYAGLLGLQSSCLWMKISFSLWTKIVSDVGNDHLPVLILIRTFCIYILRSVMQTVQTFKDNLLSYFVVFGCQGPIFFIYISISLLSAFQFNFYSTPWKWQILSFIFLIQIDSLIF